MIIQVQFIHSLIPTNNNNQPIKFRPMNMSAANGRTTVILVVIILDLFFLTGFVITGSVLISFDVSMTQQLVDQYNAVVKVC